MVAEVTILYDSNYRDVPACLECLRNEAVEDGVTMLVSVCIRNGQIDVRGMGHLDIFQTYALLAQGMKFLEPILLNTLKEKSR
ncbi:hypothetical protein UFOVP435_8 [uncultured Caudovirales phage]|uniref:Uncharacterized protein n=1 Tax=uncultured Caudovirales phage TaxID=2100421 RepID=A0A6J5M8V6_9CAUD|nr:hypothetical protein UFOVP435_8 [uncultured Caudovirales phage]